MEKTIVVLRGVPGAGKTTAAALFGAPMVAADDYFYTPSGEYFFDPSRLGAAHKWCQARVEAHMQGDAPVVVVHNTNVDAKSLSPYEELAGKYGYRLVSLVVENRHGNDSVHGVPQEKRLQMAEALKKSIKLI